MVRKVKEQDFLSCVFHCEISILLITKKVIEIQKLKNLPCRLLNIFFYLIVSLDVTCRLPWTTRKYV